MPNQIDPLLAMTALLVFILLIPVVVVLVIWGVSIVVFILII